MVVCTEASAAGHGLACRRGGQQAPLSRLALQIQFLHSRGADAAERPAVQPLPGRVPHDRGELFERTG